MNFSGISNQSLIGKLLRAPFRLIPRSTVLPILQGPLRGKKWIVGSSTLGCWLGSYEYEKAAAFAKAISPGDVVYDVGANAGFYTLLASILCGDAGHVYSFEPLPQNLEFLRRHLAMNKIANSTVIEAAVTDHDGREAFDASSASTTAHLSPRGELMVRTVRLDSLVTQGEILAPKILKIDIEGAELSALEGCAQTIRTCHPAIFLATHGAEVHRACLDFLARHDYHLESLTHENAESSAELLAR